MYGYKPEVLHEALVRCLTSKAYNARMLIEASESIRVSSGMSVIQQPQTASVPPELSNMRPEHTSIIITTNKAPTEWAQTLDDEVLASALLDRILYRCEVINLKGTSYRMENRQTIFDKQNIKKTEK